MKRQSLTARLLCSVGLAFLLLLTACLVGLFTGSVPVSFSDMLRVLTHSPTNESLQIILCLCVLLRYWSILFMLLREMNIRESIFSLLFDNLFSVL